MSAKAMAVETTTTESDSGGFRPSWRQIAATATAVVLLLLGWAWLAPRIGLAWPYPQRLPNQIELRGFNWQRDDGCVRQPYELSGGRGGTLVPFGTIASALVFGGPQMLDAAPSRKQRRRRTPTDRLLRDHRPRLLHRVTASSKANHRDPPPGTPSPRAGTARAVSVGTRGLILKDPPTRSTTRSNTRRKRRLGCAGHTARAGCGPSGQPWRVRRQLVVLYGWRAESVAPSPCAVVRAIPRSTCRCRDPTGADPGHQNTAGSLNSYPRACPPRPHTGDRVGAVSD